MKRDLLIFTSPSSAGKDYILNKCVEEFGWHKAVSHTTRIPRVGEVNRKDSFFINPMEFNESLTNNEFLETTKYKTTNGTWYYGFHKDSVSGDGIKCMILNPDGIEQLISNGYAERMMIVYVLCDTETRIKRYYNRLGDNPTEHQLAEGYLRLLRDINDFEKFDDVKQITWDDVEWDYEYKGVPTNEVYNIDREDIRHILWSIKDFIEVLNNEA